MIGTDLIFKIVVSYLIGGINFSLIVGRICGKKVENIYDKNLGAYNIYRATRSKTLFAIVALLDLLKIYLVTKFLGPMCGVFGILGHNFSIISYFITKNIFTGMGLAAFLGWSLAFDVKLFTLLLMYGVFHVLVWRKIIKAELRTLISPIHLLVFISVIMLVYFLILPLTTEYFLLAKKYFETTYYFLSIYLILSFSIFYRWYFIANEKIMNIIDKEKLEKITKERL